MNPRQSSLFSLIALIMMMLTGGCSDSENELTIKKLTTEKSSLNIQLLKAKNDIKHIKNSYIDLQNILKTSNSKESTLAKSNADFRVSIAKIKAELDAEHKKNKQLNSQVNYKSVNLFTEKNKNKLEGEIRNKYIGYLIAIIILSISIPSFIVWLISKKNKEKIVINLNNENLIKDKEISKLRDQLNESKLSHDYEVRKLENRISEGASNPIVEKINEMQYSRSIKLSSVN
jgi:hypothetical protein